MLTTHGRGNHALRDERWRFIRYADGGEELYDHAADPHEWTNLAERPEHAATIARFRGLLPAADAAPLGPKGSGKKAKKRAPEAAAVGDEPQ